MAFKSAIYDRSGVKGELKERAWQEGLLVVLVALLFLLACLLRDVSRPLELLVILGFAIGMFYWLYKDWGKREPAGKHVGDLILTEEQFILDMVIVKTSEITALRIEIGLPRGYFHWRLDGSGYRRDSGTTSMLELTSNGQTYQLNFLWDSDTRLESIKQILKHFYSRGLFVKEFYRGARTYMMEELEYEEIQEFKKKYKLTGSSY